MITKKMKTDCTVSEMVTVFNSQISTYSKHVFDIPHQYKQLVHLDKSIRSLMKSRLSLVFQKIIFVSTPVKFKLYTLEHQRNRYPYILVGSFARMNRKSNLYLSVGECWVKRDVWVNRDIAF